MTSTFFLLAGIAAVMLFGAFKQTSQLKAKLVKKLPPAQYLPKAISLLLVTAQVSELVKMVEHISIVTVAASLLLLAIVIATRSGTESQLH
jgi:hypothetical protein